MPPAYEASADAVPGPQQRMQQAAPVLPVCPGMKCPTDGSDQSMVEFS